MADDQDILCTDCVSHVFPFLCGVIAIEDPFWLNIYIEKFEMKNKGATSVYELSHF